MINYTHLTPQIEAMVNRWLDEAYAIISCRAIRADDDPGAQAMGYVMVAKLFGYHDKRQGRQVSRLPHPMTCKEAECVAAEVDRRWPGVYTHQILPFRKAQQLKAEYDATRECLNAEHETRLTAARNELRASPVGQLAAAITRNQNTICRIAKGEAGSAMFSRELAQAIVEVWGCWRSGWQPAKVSCEAQAQAEAILAQARAEGRLEDSKRDMR